MTIENYLAIAAGLVAVVCGPLMVRHRVKVFGFSSDAQRVLGGCGREEISRRLPKMLFVVLIGIGALIVAAIAFSAAWAGATQCADVTAC